MFKRGILPGSRLDICSPKLTLHISPRNSQHDNSIIHIHNSPFHQFTNSRHKSQLDLYYNLLCCTVCIPLYDTLRSTSNPIIKLSNYQIIKYLPFSLFHHQFGFGLVDETPLMEFRWGYTLPLMPLKPWLKLEVWLIASSKGAAALNARTISNLVGTLRHQQKVRKTVVGRQILVGIVCEAA